MSSIKDDVHAAPQADHTATTSSTVVNHKATTKKKSPVKVQAKTKKKPTAKVVATSTQAQSGPAIKLPFEKMNKIEKKIVKAAFPVKAHPKAERPQYSIKELMKATGVKTSLPIRNGLRRPVRGQWLEKAARGKYRVTKTALQRGITQGA